MKRLGLIELGTQRGVRAKLEEASDEQKKQRKRNEEAEAFTSYYCSFCETAALLRRLLLAGRLHT